MKYATERPYSDPEKAARRILEIAIRLKQSRTAAFLLRKSTAPFFGRRKPGRIRLRHADRDRARLTRYAQVWHLREVHACGR
jgi:hypothetical protein